MIDSNNTKCVECNKEFNASLQRCPHCGVNRIVKVTNETISISEKVVRAIKSVNETTKTHPKWSGLSIGIWILDLIIGVSFEEPIKLPIVIILACFGYMISPFAHLKERTIRTEIR